jgi:hypothetical protein
MVDVVGSQDTSRKFHEKIVFFVGAFGTGQSTDGIRPVCGFDGGKSFCDLSGRLPPSWTSTN